MVSHHPTADHASGGGGLHVGEGPEVPADRPLQGTLCRGDRPPQPVVDPADTGGHGDLGGLGVHSTLYGNAGGQAGVL